MNSPRLLCGQEHRTCFHTRLMLEEDIELVYELEQPDNLEMWGCQLLCARRLECSCSRSKIRANETYILLNVAHWIAYS